MSNGQCVKLREELLSMNFTSISSQSGRILRRAARTCWNSRPIIFLAASQTSSFFTPASIPGSLTLTPADIFEFRVCECYTKSLWVLLLTGVKESCNTSHSHHGQAQLVFKGRIILFLTILYMYTLKNVTHSHMTWDQHKTNPEFNERCFLYTELKTWKKINFMYDNYHQKACRSINPLS